MVVQSRQGAHSLNTSMILLILYSVALRKGARSEKCFTPVIALISISPFTLHYGGDADSLLSVALAELLFVDRFPPWIPCVDFIPTTFLTTEHAQLSPHPKHPQHSCHLEYSSIVNTASLHLCKLLLHMVVIPYTHRARHAIVPVPCQPSQSLIFSWSRQRLHTAWVPGGALNPRISFNAATAAHLP